MDNPRRATAWMILVVALLSLGSTARVFAAPPRNVLVLFSNSRLVPANSELDRGLREALIDAPSQPIHLFYEYLDSPEFGGEAHEQTVSTYLRAKYAEHPPEVFVAISDAAFDFLARRRHELFPGVPLVYGVVSPEVVRRYAPAEDIVGVAVDYDFAGNIAQALRFHPDAQRLIIVTGTSSRDRELEMRLRREAPAAARERRIEFWAGLPTAVLVKQLAELDTRTVVFTLGYYADGEGGSYSPAQTAPIIARASAAPVYGPLDTFIGSGIVGGRMPSFEGVGRQTGTMAAKILGGAAPASIAGNAAA